MNASPSVAKKMSLVELFVKSTNSSTYLPVPLWCYYRDSVPLEQQNMLWCGKHMQWLVEPCYRCTSWQKHWLLRRHLHFHQSAAVAEPRISAKFRWVLKAIPILSSLFYLYGTRALEHATLEDLYKSKQRKISERRTDYSSHRREPSAILHGVLHDRLFVAIKKIKAFQFSADFKTVLVPNVMNVRYVNS